MHIDLNRDISAYAITKKLNSQLQAWNEQIRILKTTKVPNDFDSRRHAMCRTYLYRFAVCKEKVPQGIKPKDYKYQMFIPVEEFNRCYFVLNEGFDIDRVKESAKQFEGIHDFRSFMKVSKEQKSLHPRFCHRFMESVKVQPGNTLATSFNIDRTLELYDFWDIEFKSRAYFYRQIRNMVATLIAVGNKRITQRDVYEMLTIPSKYSWSHKIQPAPSSGLYLTNVEYPEELMNQIQSNTVDEDEPKESLLVL